MSLQHTTFHEHTVLYRWDSKLLTVLILSNYMILKAEVSLFETVITHTVLYRCKTSHTSNRATMAEENIIN